jgi:hypothetical protein
MGDKSLKATKKQASQKQGKNDLENEKRKREVDAQGVQMK